MILIQLAAALLLAPLTQHHHFQHFAQARADKEYEVKLILEHIEEETLKFRDEIERAYGERCNTETLSQCSKSNFNACSSVFPNQQCMKADELVIGECGGGGGNCNALWDKTTSAVRIPSAHLARGLDPEIIETACYTLLADDYMRTKYENDEIFWEAYKVHPSLTYFGAHNGLFRILPALGQVECGNYDPRKRPWFVAASSGPKDVIIVLDVSGSMSNYGKMDLAKKAAITVVDTLTISDRVAVIVFSDSAYQVPVGVGGGTDSLIRATNENKKLLIESIRQLSGGGATNFYAGFQQAFDALERTIEQEYTTGCNVAILFMTDGARTTGPETDEVLGLINNSTQRLATLYGRDTKIFTFSLGAQADHLVTKEIACSTNGMWTPVDDIYGDLVGAMASYYKLFTLGLGDDTEFTAWVEPYEFFSAKKMGTTNSAPVFDRSVDPPLFLGVVAIDINLDALEQVLGEDAQSSTMLQRFILLSTAQCPTIHLSECQLDALRYLSGGQEATCGRCNSTEYPGIIPAECSLKPDLPNNLWQNTDMEGVKYEDRTCCEIGSNVPSEMCPNEIDTSSSNEISIGIIVGSSIASLCVICCCGWVFYKKCYVSSSKSDDALYQIHVTKKATHNRIRCLEKVVETAEKNALSYQKKKVTKVALVHMRRRKAALEEIERCAAILENLTAGEIRLERAKGDVQLVKSYSQLKEALQDVRRSSGMENEDVKELVSDVCEEMELANSDALTKAIYNSDAIDEDELYEELRMLELKCENKSPSPRKSEVNTDEQVDFPSSEEVVNAPTESPADEKPQKSTAEPKSAPLPRS